jgi:hypothetical protein
MLATRLARLAAISVIAFAGLTAAASAAGVAYTKGPANLREGPGTSYDVITTLAKNTEVSVEACTATWCAVTTEDDDEGFVAKSLLKANPSGPDVPFSIQIIIGPEGPFLKFGDIFLDVPDEPSDEPEVCFYQQSNLHGANFCVEEGDEDNKIPGNFDNNIESILISGGLGVEVCSGAGHSGECFYYTKTQKSLPSSIRNKITSYAVDDGQGGFDLNGDDEEDDEGDNIIILQ